MSTPGPLEPSILAELRDLQKSTSPTFLAELIDLFFKQADDLIPKLRKALGDRDLDVFVRISHTLKGTCGSVGALRMTEMCARLNQMGRKGEWGAMEGPLSGLEAEYKLVHAALEAEKSR